MVKHTPRTMEQTIADARQMVAAMPEWKKGSPVNSRDPGPLTPRDIFHAGFMAGRYGEDPSEAAYLAWQREQQGRNK
jgi:hypothetical protein